MTRVERQSLNQRIVKFYLGAAKRKKNVVIQHFLEKIPRRTIYNVLKKYENSKTVKDKDTSGHPKKLCRGSMTRLKCLVNHKTGVSLRRLGSKFEVNHETVRKCLKELDTRVPIPNFDRKMFAYLHRYRSPLFHTRTKIFFRVHDLWILLFRMVYNSSFGSRIFAEKSAAYGEELHLSLLGVMSLISTLQQNICEKAPFKKKSIFHEFCKKIEGTMSQTIL